MLSAGLCVHKHRVCAGGSGGEGWGLTPIIAGPLAETCFPQTLTLMGLIALHSLNEHHMELVKTILARKEWGSQEVKLGQALILAVNSRGPPPST